MLRFKLTHYQIPRSTVLLSDQIEPRLANAMCNDVQSISTTEPRAAAGFAARREATARAIA